MEAAISWVKETQGGDDITLIRYASKLAYVPKDAPSFLANIAVKAVAYNKPQEVGGVLRFSQDPAGEDVYVAQALEGPSSVVTTLYEKICNDPRHTMIATHTTQRRYRKYEGFGMMTRDLPPGDLEEWVSRGALARRERLPSQIRQHTLSLCLRRIPSQTRQPTPSPSLPMLPSQTRQPTPSPSLPGTLGSRRGLLLVVRTSIRS